MMKFHSKAEDIELVYNILKTYLFADMGKYLKDFDVDNHTSGEPVYLYGSSLRPLARKIIKALSV